jgi:hypothetical protein
MNSCIKRLENLFMAVSFAEANYMNLFTLCVNESLSENAFLDNRIREEPTDKSKYSVEIHRSTEMQHFHS